MIFHIAHGSDWEAALAAGSYTVESLEAEGFIHLSTREQVLATAERYYKAVARLVLLSVDDTLLDPDLLRFEPSPTGDLFPHYYARIPIHAVGWVHRFPPRPDGGFDWPEGQG